MVFKNFDRKVYYGIYDALSARDYKLHEALGEIIDNSIANNYVDEHGNVEKVVVKININDKIIITDNGIGQDAQGLAESWSLGKPNNKKNSRFGVGLKQAAPGLGNIVILESKQFGEKYVHKFVFDKKENEKTQLVHSIPIKVEDIHISSTSYSESDHFFKVTIKNLNRAYNRTTLIKTRELLSSYFSSYIRNKEMDIIFQNEKLKAPRRPKLVYKEKFESKKYGITGWWGITEKGTMGRTKKFGPDTFYNGRLTTQGDINIVNVNNHPNYYRLESEIYFTSPTIFDNNLTSSKNNWVKNENYYQVQQWLERNIKNKYLKNLDNVRSKEKHNEADKKIDIAAQEFPKIARDLFPELRKSRSETVRKKAGDKYEGESKFYVEQRVVNDDNDKQENKKSQDWEDKRQGKNKHQQIRHHTYIMIDGIKYYIKIKPVDYLDSIYPRYASTINENETTLEITINLNNPYVQRSKEENTDMLLINIGEWIIESILQHALKITDIKTFFEEREDKIAQVDWNEWLNQIDLSYAEKQLAKKYPLQ